MFRHVPVIFLILVSSLNIYALEKRDQYSGITVDAKIAECVASIKPDISAVQKRALEYSRLVPEDLTEWKRKAKLAAFLPRLQFGYERQATDSVNVDFDDSVSVTSAGVSVGPTDSGWGQDYNRKNNIEVTAVWYLDELIFNRDSLSVANEARAQISARRDMLGEVNEFYFELKRLVSLYLKNPGELRRKRGELRLDIERLIAKIDVYTGGWFKESFYWREARCEKS